MCSAPGRLRSPSQDAEQLVSRDTPVLSTLSTRHPGMLLQGMEGSLISYLDRPQVKTSIETDKGVKKRLDLGHDCGELKGNHNLAFTISKPELKPPGRVTAV